MSEKVTVNGTITRRFSSSDVPFEEIPSVTGELICYWDDPLLYEEYMRSRRDIVRTFVLAGKTTHGKNRVREQGAKVIMVTTCSCGGEVLVKHMGTSDKDGNDFIRWINIDGNDKNFETEEVFDV